MSRGSAHNSSSVQRANETGLLSNRGGNTSLTNHNDKKKKRMKIIKKKQQSSSLAVNDERLMGVYRVSNKFKSKVVEEYERERDNRKMIIKKNCYGIANKVFTDKLTSPLLAIITNESRENSVLSMKPGVALKQI